MMTSWFCLSHDAQKTQIFCSFHAQFSSFYSKDNKFCDKVRKLPDFRSKKERLSVFSERISCDFFPGRERKAGERYWHSGGMVLNKESLSSHLLPACMGEKVLKVHTNLGWEEISPSTTDREHSRVTYGISGENGKKWILFFDSMKSLNSFKMCFRSLGELFEWFGRVFPRNSLSSLHTTKRWLYAAGNFYKLYEKVIRTKFVITSSI